MSYQFQFNLQDGDEVTVLSETVYVKVGDNLYKQWSEGVSVPTNVYNAALPSLFNSEGEPLVASVVAPVVPEIAPVAQVIVEDISSYKLDASGNTVNAEDGSAYAPAPSFNENEVEPGPPQEDGGDEDPNSDHNEIEVEPGPPQEEGGVDDGKSEHNDDTIEPGPPQEEIVAKAEVAPKKPKSTFKKRS